MATIAELLGQGHPCGARLEMHERVQKEYLTFVQYEHDVYGESQFDAELDTAHLIAKREMYYKAFRAEAVEQLGEALVAELEADAYDSAPNLS